MANYNRMFNNPLTVLGATMMQGFDPHRQGLGGLGIGILGAGQQAMQNEQLAQRQAMAEAEQARAQQMADLQMRIYQSKLNQAGVAQEQAAQEQANREALAQRYPEHAEAIMAGLGAQVVASQLRAPQRAEPYSEAAKIRADQQAGFISQELADAQIQALTSGGGLERKDQLNLANTLRDDLRSETSGFGTVKDNWDSMRSAGDNPLGDVTRTFAYMKMLDPGSTVREGEQATVENAGGISETLRSLYNNALMGRGMTQSKRRALEAEAGNIFNTRLQNYENTRSRYQRIGAQYGIAPEEIASTREYEPYAPDVVTIREPGLAPPAKERTARQGRKARRDAQSRNIDALLEKYR